LDDVEPNLEVGIGDNAVSGPIEETNQTTVSWWGIVSLISHAELPVVVVIEIEIGLRTVRRRVVELGGGVASGGVVGRFRQLTDILNLRGKNSGGEASRR
jgi:hypothetical protein